jgi:DDE family transposase
MAPGRRSPGILRPGNAAANATADLIEVAELARAQLPAEAADQQVLVRTDTAGTAGLAWHLHHHQLRFSLGLEIDEHVREAILGLPASVWQPTTGPDGRVRDGAEACELTGWIDLTGWPLGTRAICRRERAHPGAQLRFTDHDGHRFQVLVTDQTGGDLAALELRHRLRARAEDRIRCAKATGLRNLPFDRFRRNAVWLELVLAAQDLTCWLQALLLEGDLAVAEPKTLRYRLLHVAARVVRHARRLIVRLPRTWPWARELAGAFVRLRALPLRC